MYDRPLRGDEFRAAYVAGGSSTGSGRRCRGRPLLQINPQQGKALALAGSAAFEARQFARALDYWQRLLVLVPADSEMAKSINAGIAQATAYGVLTDPTTPAWLSSGNPRNGRPAA